MKKAGRSGMAPENRKNERDSKEEIKPMEKKNRPVSSGRSEKERRPGSLAAKIAVIALIVFLCIVMLLPSMFV